jgi:hypothetical protein
LVVGYAATFTPEQLALARNMQHFDRMRALRAFAESVLIGAFFSGQLMAPSCPMLSGHDPEAEAHSHTHAHTHGTGSAKALTEHPGDAETESPAGPCVMTATCGVSVITEARISLEALLAHREQSSLWLETSYTDPISLTTTPPPRI